MRLENMSPQTWVTKPDLSINWELSKILREKAFFVNQKLSILKANQGKRFTSTMRGKSRTSWIISLKDFSTVYRVLNFHVSLIRPYASLDLYTGDATTKKVRVKAYPKRTFYCFFILVKLPIIILIVFY